MFVEIGALVQKSVGNDALHKIIDCKGVEYAFMETGRSNDLFEERQFGDFGEAAIISVIAEVSAKDEVMKSLHAYCNFCLLYTSPSPRDKRQSRMPSSA